MRVADVARQFVRRRLGWRTVGVRCIVTDERHQRVLLVQHTYGKSGWYLPGGGVHRGETLVAAARREVFEETGEQALEPLKLLGAYSHLTDGRNDHVVLYLLIGRGNRAPTARNLEIRASEYFPIENLPEDISPSSRQRIREWRREVESTPTW
jgi:ADP-ribose pyrophosphatase YjhB (NUDIX family)